MNGAILRMVGGLLALWSILFADAALSQATGKQCPQPRFTGKAPDEYLARKNPLTDTPENLAAGERLFKTGAAGACSFCHGVSGNGDGPLAGQFEPPPRDFTCGRTVNGIPDGQLFWIIRFGSPGTAMPDHPQFTDEQIWQIVIHLRRLAQ
jgi:mono/diheme cytochrome c family protein